MTFLIKTAIAVAVVYALSPLNDGEASSFSLFRHLPQAAQTAQAAAQLDPAEKAALAQLAATLAQKAMH